jgi:hypothetical protein
MLSVRNQNMPWWKVLAELIDNSFDHGAMRVTISCSGNILEVQDDGVGMKSVESAITFGEHVSSPTTQLGMYGVGLKDAWLAVSDTIEIVSNYKGTQSHLRMSFNDWVANNWFGPKATHAESVASSGTTIRFHIRKQRNKPSLDVWSKLAWVFTPALEDGKQILRKSGKKKKETLAAQNLPVLTDRVCESFSVNGKEVAMDIGIVDEGNEVNGQPFWIAYGHRMITASSIGAQGYSTLRMAGLIRLGKGWSLTKNKDDLADYQPELAEEIHRRILPLLKKAEALTEEIESSALKEELEDLLNESIDEAKREARSRTTESPGSVEPQHTGVRRRKASKVSSEPGSVTGTACGKRRGLKIGWFYDEPDVLGKYDSLCKQVNLNLKHPYVEFTKGGNNSMALYAVAVGIYAEYECNTDKKGDPTLFEVKDFRDFYGSILKNLKKVKHGNGK